MLPATRRLLRRRLRRLPLHLVAATSSFHYSVSFLPSFSLLPPRPSPRQILQVHAHLVVLGFSSSTVAMAHLLSACATTTIPPYYPLSIYSRINLPGVFATNNLIRCLAKAASHRHALEVYAHMRRKGTPTNNYTYPFVLEACGTDPPLLREGLQVHGHAVMLGHVGDVFVRNGLVHFYGVCRLLDDARKVFDETPHRRDVVSWNAMIAAYARDGGRIDECKKLFDEMPQRDEVSWSTMIMGYVRSGLLENGFLLFREMVESEVKPNEATLVTVLSATAQLGLIEHGHYVRSTIRIWNFPLTVAIGTALLEMYAKCGCIAAAQKVFDEMPKRDVFAWNSMICGLAVHGLGSEALELFERFIGDGFRPNGVTFVGVLNACARSGLVDEGRRHFKSMVEVYGLEPEMEHYGCMVDLLGRAGLVAEALALVEGMEMDPDPVMWRTLLGACKIHGAEELGVEIGKKLVGLLPAHDGDHVLLSAIHANARKWENAARVRSLMSLGNVRKAAGWSLVEVGRHHHYPEICGNRKEG